MKTLLILITSILLFSCDYDNKKEPIVREIRLANKQDNGKYFIEVELGQRRETFWTNIEYRIGDTLTKSINPRSYQIQIIDQNHALLYDNNKLIGRFKFTNTQLDSLITKDNQ